MRLFEADTEIVVPAGGTVLYPLAPLPGPVSGSGLKKVVVLDTETSGLESDAKIVELAMLELMFDPATDAVVGSRLGYHGFEDPKTPLSDEVRRVTGLTDADVAGQRLDHDVVEQVMSDCVLVIAHNAGFDRPKFEHRFPDLYDSQPWACSKSELPWRDWGAPSTSLSPLLWFMGHVFIPHRAVNDVTALAGLLMLPRPVGSAIGPGDSVFKQLLASARQCTHRVFARSAAFECKDKLKSRGYSWNPDAKVWHIDVRDLDGHAEREWLLKNTNARPDYESMSARSRYK